MENNAFRIGQSVRLSEIAGDIQGIRWTLSKIEEKINENPSQSLGNTIMKQLYELYKSCKGIDEVLNTKHFDEEHFDGPVEKLKARSKGNAQMAMAEHVSRMFSENGHASEKPEGAEEKKDEQKKEAEAAPTSANEVAVAWQKAEGERAEKDDREMCLKMLSLMKGQLLKCHEDLTRRLGAAGGQNAIFSPEDLAETNEEASNDLEGIMSSILGATRQHIQRQLVALFSPLGFASISSVEAMGPPPQNGTSSTPDNVINIPENVIDMVLDSEDTAAPSGVTSEDISKALYGTPSKDTSKDDGPEKEKSADPQGAADAVAGPSNADVSKGDNKDDEEGKSICGVLSCFFPAFCLYSVANTAECRLVSSLSRLMN